jgi:hypothetical protein
MAFAALRIDNIATIGRSRLQRGVDIGGIVDIVGNQARRVGVNQYEIEIMNGLIEAAWIGDVEDAYDMFWRQLITYVALVRLGVDPMWSAVTGYYAAFFGVRALLAAVGRGSRRLGKVGPMPAGVYSMRLGAATSVNTVTLQCRSVGGASHKVLWQELDQLLLGLGGIGGLDARSQVVIAGLRSVAQAPVPLHSFRNQVNYSLGATTQLSPWSCELDAIEDEVGGIVKSCGTSHDQAAV